MLSRAPSGLAGWIHYIGDAEIPVLARTAERIDALRSDEDDIAPRVLVEIALEDPLMALKVLAHVSRHRPARMVTDTETVTAAIVMMGISTFFKAFSPQVTVEQHLAGHPGALAGLHQVLQRSHRAARFALGFALHRLDTDVEAIQEAALLNDFAEALLWCHAPLLALEIQRRQQANPTLRSKQVQMEVLNVELCDLEHALMKAWRLPELLQLLTNDRLSRSPRVQNVRLATALARHSHAGWRNAAVPDDVDAIAGLLNLSAGTVRGMLRELDETAAAEMLD